MPSFMPIGLKLWALEGYGRTDRRKEGQSYFNNTSLQARSSDLPASPAGLLGRFAPSGLKRVKMQKKKFLPFLTHYVLRATREVHENFRKK